MRTVVAVLLFALGGLAGCVDDEPEPESPTVIEGVGPDGFSEILSTGWTHELISFESEHADFPVFLEAYVPDPATTLDGKQLPETFPTLLMASPYWGSGVGPDLSVGYPPYDALWHRLIQRGYAIVMGDSASMGGSGGCWDFMGPIEVSSTLALVDAVRSQPWSNGLVGTHGLSYDGMTQIMASSHAAEGLVTVIPAAPLTHAYAGLYMGGIHYGGFWHATTLVYTESSLTPPTSQEKQGGWLDGVAQSPECAETNVQGNDPTGAYNAWFRERDFRPLGRDVTASVFFIQGWTDANVKPDNFGEWFESVPGDKKAWLGWWPHTYPTADHSGRTDLILTLHRWLDHELKGIPNGILDEPVIDTQDSQGRWRHEDAWPPKDMQLWNLTLSGDLKLVPEGEAGAQRGGVFVGDPQDLVMSIIGGDVYTTLTWEADYDVRLAGVPVLQAQVASDRTSGYLIAELWEVGGKADQRISRGAINLQTAGEPGSANLLTPGVPVDVELLFYPTDYILAEGHTLELRLTVQDATGWFDPHAEQALLTVTAGEDASWLSLPVIERSDAPFLIACGYHLAPYADDCFRDDREDEGIGG